MERPVKWVANLKHVREMSLLGSADLGFWQERLRGDSVVPLERDGRAEVMVVAAEGRFRGVGFRELSFSVVLDPPDKSAMREACFLVQAFNSRRFFAFCERVFFATPYEYGDVRLAAGDSPSIRLLARDEVLFRAELGVDASGTGRTPWRQQEATWEGTIYLPEIRPGKAGGSRFFLGRLGGLTRTYPFLPESDSLVISPFGKDGALEALIDSNFAARQWTVRGDATHAKSKTYARQYS